MPLPSLAPGGQQGDGGGAMELDSSSKPLQASAARALDASQSQDKVFCDLEDLTDLGLSRSNSRALNFALSREDADSHELRLSSTWRRLQALDPTEHPSFSRGVSAALGGTLNASLPMLTGNLTPDELGALTASVKRQISRQLSDTYGSLALSGDARGMLLCASLGGLGESFTGGFSHSSGGSSSNTMSLSEEELMMDVDQAQQTAPVIPSPPAPAPPAPPPAPTAASTVHPSTPSTGSLASAQREEVPLGHHLARASDPISPQPNGRGTRRAADEQKPRERAPSPEKRAAPDTKKKGAAQKARGRAATQVRAIPSEEEEDDEDKEHGEDEDEDDDEEEYDPRGRAVAPKRGKRKAKSPRGGGDVEQGDEKKRVFDKCKKGVERLAKLDEAINMIASGRWGDNESELLEERLRSNRFYDAIKANIVARKVEWLSLNAQVLETSDAPPADLNLSSKARQCSTEATEELKLLRCMEKSSIRTMHVMMGALSQDIPVYQEEAVAAASRARDVFNPAKLALVHAVDRNIEKKKAGGDGGGGRERKDTPEGSKVLEEWLVAHFEDPYPTEGQKLDLCEESGLSMRQVTNWLSNARIRLWRPALEAM